MKVIMIYDQIQAGAGTKDDKMVPLAAKKEAVGPAVMMEPFLKQVDGKVLACLYCGNGYYLENKEEVTRKLVAMVNKLQPDVVMCGPAFNYVDYAGMAAHVATEINAKTNVPAFAAMSVENEATIAEFKDKVMIVKTPKKGGTGLNDALKNMCTLAKAMSEKQDTSELKETICF
ncbi:GrdB-related putative oxidoreductase [[Eubacterium] hominis]|uniref:GrdB-related putative oxidoreductase n=1 Tax=[Eubacterium] hominis TaxID=2764325 RepID=UPI003A4D538D